MANLIKSTSVYWCNEDDRYVLVVKKNGEVVGLNYMQGNEIEDFEKHYDYVDEGLTNFYNAIEVYLSGTTEIDRINQAIWAYFSYKNDY